MKIIKMDFFSQKSILGSKICQKRFYPIFGLKMALLTLKIHFALSRWSFLFFNSKINFCMKIIQRSFWKKISDRYLAINVTLPLICCKLIYIFKFSQISIVMRLHTGLTQWKEHWHFQVFYQIGISKSKEVNIFHNQADICASTHEITQNI